MQALPFLGIYQLITWLKSRLKFLRQACKFCKFIGRPFSLSQQFILMYCGRAFRCLIIAKEAENAAFAEGIT